jgi:hypothetical protein
MDAAALWMILLENRRLIGAARRMKQRLGQGAGNAGRTSAELYNIGIDKRSRSASAVFRRRATMSARILASGCFIAIALLVQPAAAQTLHKSIMPDGRVVYGDRPEPGAVKVETSKPDTSRTGVQVIPPGAESKVQQMEAARKREDAKVDQRRQAEEAVRRAEAALANGKEPLPGERIGTAGGASRLTDSYWARQKQLQEDLVKARDNLNRLRIEDR